MENEEERKKQLLNMKSYFIKIGVRCMEDKYTVKEIKQKWISEFCSLLTEEEQKRCHMNQFMWHAFSYKMVEPILKGRLAKEQFDNEKSQMYICLAKTESKCTICVCRKDLNVICYG